MAGKKKTRRPYDPTLSKRIAQFVAGQQGIPSERFRAAFPSAGSSVMSLLVALGYVAHTPQPRAFPPGAREKGLELRRRRALDRAKKTVASIEAKLAVTNDVAAGAS